MVDLLVATVSYGCLAYDLGWSVGIILYHFLFYLSVEFFKVPTGQKEEDRKDVVLSVLLVIRSSLLCLRTARFMRGAYLSSQRREAMYSDVVDFKALEERQPLLNKT